VVRLGQIDDSYRHGTLASADVGLQTLIEAGRFVRERAETFTFVYHCDSVATWLTYMAEHWSTARISEGMIARAQAEAREEAAEARVLRVMQAARLRRV
jgi:hypothetical protein